MIGDRVIRTDIEMVCVARDGQVHLLFSEKNQTGEPVPAYTANFLMSAADALRFSVLLADLAFEQDTSLKPAGPALKAELVDRHRKKLTDRFALMLNSLRERKTVPNRKLARDLVDTALTDIFT